MACAFRRLQIEPDTASRQLPGFIPGILRSRSPRDPRVLSLQHPRKATIAGMLQRVAPLSRAGEPGAEHLLQVACPEAPSRHPEQSWEDRTRILISPLPIHGGTTIRHGPDFSAVHAAPSALIEISQRRTCLGSSIRPGHRHVHGIACGYRTAISDVRTAELSAEKRTCPSPPHRSLYWTEFRDPILSQSPERACLETRHGSGQH